jgi:hypothetical protein
MAYKLQTKFSARYKKRFPLLSYAFFLLLSLKLLVSVKSDFIDWRNDSFF